MRIFSLVLILLKGSNGKLPDEEKIEFCENLKCDENVDRKVCGVKFGENFSYRVFDNECQLLKHGCQVDENDAYGIINMEFCGGPRIIHTSDSFEKVQFTNDCRNCTQAEDKPVCGIRQDGEGFRIRTFDNECDLIKHNCLKGTRFIVTDFFVCNDGKPENNNNNGNDKAEPIITEAPKKAVFKNIRPLVVIDGSMIDKHNINKSIDDFFAATHVMKLPLYEHHMNESTRKRFIPIFGPNKIFKPWTIKPENVTEDFMHTPLITSCFHKCPTKCPDTYAPVCGMAGIVSKEPALMFINHCYMDVAQCKMYTEEKSTTATSSAYVESGFVFCLGDQLGQVYRFMPLLRTLQHMGRVKKRGRFKYKIRNLRFINNLLRHPGTEKLMGKK